MLQVEVKLYGVLRDYRPAVAGRPHHSFAVDLPQPATGADLARHLSLPEDLVASLSINNAAADLRVLLHPGDKVSFFPPTAGG